MRRMSPDVVIVHLWSLSEDVVLHRTARGEQLVLTSRWGVDRLERPDPLVYETLRRMELGPVLLGNAAASGRQHAEQPVDVRAFMLPTLTRLSHLVVRTLGVDDLRGPLLSVFPLVPDAPFTLRLSGIQPVRLPGTAVLTSVPSGFSLEAAGCPHRVVLHRPEAAMVVALLAWPVTHEAAAASLPLPPQVTESVLRYLAAAGMAVAADDDSAEAGAAGR